MSRWKHKPSDICQNCKYSNNKKGNWIRTWKRKDGRNLYIPRAKEKKGFWHIYCEKHKKYYPWDYRKRCIKRKKNKI